MSSSKKTKKKPKFKVQTRMNNSKARKIEADKIEDFVKYYKTQSMDNNSIILESTNILEQLDTPRIHDRNELLSKYEALKIIMEKRLIDTYNSDFDYIYPDYYDSKFNTKIFSKKEFRLNKIPKKDVMTSDEKETHSQKMCNPSKDKTFKLTPNQKFLKTFMSPNTPYNSILLYHGTGVGKTCSSISIAEQYSQELNDSNKKIIILLNPSIKANFQKNIFNIQKVKENLPYYQCTGEKYLKEINVDNLSSISTDVLEQKINKIIKNRYEFYGYKQFANIITKLQDTIKTRYDKKDFSKIFEKKIKEMFSNSVMIIDEVHNIKKGVDTALVSPLLEKVIKIADNMKLLLLSATPMFDTSKEIIFLINLMLMNDNRPTIKASDFFDKNEKLIESKKVLFESKIRGYISYMRGEDPFRFPTRMYPSNTIKFKNMPILDSSGKVITNPISTLNIVGCVMEGYQKKIYEKMDTNTDLLSQSKKKENYGNFNQKAIMCSNIIYPNNDMENIDNYSVDDFVSEKGFSNILKLDKGKYTFKDVSYKSIFKLENLKQYSSKIANIVEHIKKNADKPGIIFIYSQFINNGIIPIALALEYLGYSKHNGSLIEDSIRQKGNYIIISGNKEISHNAYSDYIKLQHSNKHGEKIKIILGSESAAEGLDFSYIREVHILDPWHHLNKIEQVIGRGIRNCSHIDLDKDQRNVTIYLYAATKSVNPSKDVETIDLKIYRSGEEKSKQMSEIEYLLKINSVDCEVNIEGNKFETDNDGTKKCNYKECDYKCNLDTSHPETSNTLSMNESIIQDLIDETKREIMGLFKIEYIYKLEDLKRELEKEELLIYLALNELILNKVTINTDTKSGYIIYRDQHYIFNKHNSSKFVSFNNIRKINSKRNNSYNISNNSVLTKLKGTTSKKTKPLFVLAERKNEKMGEVGKNIMEKNFPTTKEIPINQVIEILNNMKITNKEILLQYLITRFYDTELITPHEKYILNNMYNVLYSRPKIIWGYKIAHNNTIVYKKYNDGIFGEPTKEEVIIMKKQFEQTKKRQKPPAQIIGYYEIKKSDNSILFKIRDKNDEGKKGTQKKTGSICNNGGMKKDKIIQYIEFVLGKVKYSNRASTNSPKKPDLCYELEKTFLSAQNKSGSKFRYLYNAEETIEYELNKK